jgi:hypothetical protein
MFRRRTVLAANSKSRKTLCLLLAVPALAAQPALVVDRGLPQSNLNNAAGAARSNLRLSVQADAFMGDDFTIGTPGEQWVIDSIRVWSVPGLGSPPALYLGDYYQDSRLYFGGAGQDLSPVVTAKLTAGSNETSNPNVKITEATANGAQLYDDFGQGLRIWQVDFQNLNLTAEGGVKYSFGVWGMGRPSAAHGGKTYLWFNHASNAALSGAKQDGADGRILEFDASGRYRGDLTTENNDWDKPADINVQVFAHPVKARQQ